MKKIVFIVCLVIFFLLLVFSVFFSIININNNNILNGISINGIDISGMSKEEAISALTQIIEEKTSNNIIVSISDDSQITSTFDYLEIEYNISDYVSQAYNIGRSGNIFENNFEILGLLFNSKNIDIELSLNEENLEALINEISANLPNKVVQSSYYIEDNNLIITSGSEGDILDEDSFKNNLYNTLSNLSSLSNYIEISTENVTPDNIDIEEIYNSIHKDVQDAYYETQPLKVYSEVTGISFDLDYAKTLLETTQDEYTIPLEYTYPEVTVSDLDINIFQNTLGSYTTLYNTYNEDRVTNLELAAEKISGTILAPGEEFSYNTIVGARTIQAGYKEAKVYSNGQVVDGIGGGICQISSTLYNAVVLANLEVTERYNHQFVTSYTEAGRDATVVYGVKDLKFVNTRSYPIKIEIKVVNGIVSCSIYGLYEDTEYDIDFDIETLSVTSPAVVYEYDNSVDIGKETIKQYGSNGTVVNVYKVTKLNGTVISRTLISQDTYNSLDKIIIKNSASD